MSGTAPLIDANVLIALSTADHVHNERAESWFVEQSRLALCPIVEGALVRFLLRNGESGSTVSVFLRALYASDRLEFWSDNLSYSAVNLARLHGHRQATDAYLVALAEAHHTRLATLDEGLAATHPRSTILLP